MNSTRHEKLLTSLRYWLIGLASANPNYHKVLEALEFFADLHKEEIRKNGARGFYHQLSILAFVRNYHPMIPNPIDVYITILGHDSVEDYPQEKQRIFNKFPDHYHYLVRISKIRDGVKLTNDAYYDELATCVVCIIAKGADRIHNLSTMGDKGAFSYTKQAAYTEETRMYVIPMLKIGRRDFPHIEPICEAFKSVVTMQCQATDRMLYAVEKSVTSMQPKLIEEHREAFEKQFHLDLWAVADWLRNKNLLASPSWLEEKKEVKE